MSQLSFLSIAHAKKELKRDKFLNQMKETIPWKRLYNVIKPYYLDAHLGRKRKELTLMLRISCLQQWYNLSDPSVEEEIYDRASFQKFLEIDLLNEPVPDETTILNFRHLLREHDLFEKIFDEINQYLTEKGFLMKSGTIVDATLISAPSSTKNESKKRDPEMSSTKKNGQWTFGMKAHIGVDAQSGLVHSLSGTTAKDHDSTQFEKLLHGDEKILLGDSAYANKKKQRVFEKQGVIWAIQNKGSRYKKLTEADHERNRAISTTRARVEHPFQVIKCQWNYTKVRYRGVKKNLDQIRLLFGLYNIFKVRKKLLLA